MIAKEVVNKCEEDASIYLQRKYDKYMICRVTE